MTYDLEEPKDKVVTEDWKVDYPRRGKYQGRIDRGIRYGKDYIKSSWIYEAHDLTGRRSSKQGAVPLSLQTLRDLEPLLPYPVALDEKIGAIMQERDKLPMRQQAYLSDLLDRIHNETHFTIEGPTGCGKSLQIPQLFLRYLDNNDDFGRIMLVVSRSLVAVSIGTRLRNELGVPRDYVKNNKDCRQPVCIWTRVGGRLNDGAKIVVATKGMALRAIQEDPTMADYSVMLFDDVHEMSAQQSLLFEWSRWVRAYNQDIRFGYMSASCDFARLRNIVNLNEENHIRLPGLEHELEIRYAEQHVEDVKAFALRTVIEILNMKAENGIRVKGNILIFASGSRKCDEIAKIIKESWLVSSLETLEVHSLYADKDEKKTQLATDDEVTPVRRIIIGTNVAETGITFPDTTFVVDLFMQKISVYDPISNCSSCRLVEEQITADQAILRAGRAGRQGKGYAFRAVTEAEFHELSVLRAHPFPKILVEPYHELLLADMYLLDVIRACGMTSSGPPKILTLHDHPSLGYVVRAVDTLRLVPAITVQQPNGLTLTDLGRVVASLSLKPELAVAVLASMKLGCLGPMMLLGAANATTKPILLTDRDLATHPEALINRKKIETPFGDLINAFKAFHLWLRVYVIKKDKNGMPMYRRVRDGHSVPELDREETDKARRTFAHSHGLRHSPCVEAEHVLRPLPANLRAGFSILHQTIIANQPLIEAMQRSLVYGFLHKIAVRNELNGQSTGSSLDGTHYNWRDGGGRYRSERESRFHQTPCLLYTDAHITGGSNVPLIRGLIPVKMQWVYEAARKPLDATKSDYKGLRIFSQERRDVLRRIPHMF